ncbi:MAG: 5'/3'-nucleotidase SurE [Anaerolineae bacterium]|jgi:5'-nucleotidase|nr:5'/3'-nucleotidase SurE [Anaerolineae bacterium]
MKNILVTNDDGITSDGLLTLAEQMRDLGNVHILAPDRNWSASGHVRTLERPLRVKEMQLPTGMIGYACDGAPSDCVALALRGFFDEKFDLVVSGINPYANFGHDVTYSGTVTAAMEAVIWDVPAIAVSLDQPDHFTGVVDFKPAARVAQKVAATVLSEGGLPDNILLNVNVPFLPEEAMKNVQITYQGLRVYHDRVDKRIDPRGRPYYWIIGEMPTGISEAGTDIGALVQGDISITPIQLDLTAHQWIDRMRFWDWGMPVAKHQAAATPVELPNYVYVPNISP